MDNFDYPAIGQRIKQLRKRKGLNQTELAQMLKKSLRTVQKYETGEIAGNGRGHRLQDQCAEAAPQQAMGVLDFL